MEDLMQEGRTRAEIQHRGHTIVGAATKAGPTAAIYLGKKSATTERFIAATIGEAIDLAKRWVDAKYDETAAKRSAPHIATVQEYVDALKARHLKSNELAMLKSHARAGTLSAAQLADAAGYASYEGANVHYGALGRAISEMLHLQPQLRADGSPIWTTILASGVDQKEGDSAGFRWRIHPQLVEALDKIGM